MSAAAEIRAIRARQVFSDRGHPGIETTIVTAGGAAGVAVVTAGISVGQHEVQFAYDGGPRWRGMGVGRAVAHVHEIIAPALLGLDATRQAEVDAALLALDGTPTKAKLGGNALASVSAAALQAGAMALGIPLYQHIGGVNACVLPVPGVICVLGSRRYGGGARSGGKPSYSFICHGFSSFSEASYAAWDVSNRFAALLGERLGLDARQGGFVVPPGLVQHDRALWDLMALAVAQGGYEGCIGLQVDVAAGTYWDAAQGLFVGLFSPESKTREQLMALYRQMVAEYPFVIVEDPLDEEDYAGHAQLTRELGIEVVGDDLFTTDPQRVRLGIAHGACNAVLLKVNQIGTISEAFEMVRLAYRHGYGVMPCNSRGEGPAIADYAVGLNAGHLREGGTGPVANRFLQIEAELGPRAHFAGREGLKP